MPDLLKDLNEAQQLAVKDTEGPALVIAGAGSGKTRVLTYRIAHLLQKGAVPAEVLALTFTNKAAREMKERIGRLVGEDLARYLWMGTFHSVFARILRGEGHLLGYPEDYSIYDTADSKNVVKTVVREMKLDEQVYKPGEVFGRISRAKNNLITPKVYAGSHQLIEQDKRSRKPMMQEVYEKYVQQCRKSGAMDFDDLLLNTYLLFRDHNDVLDRYRRQFAYLLVDEYQDTNYVQYRIINQLGEQGRNICVVGDDAQSIYSFRGARIENILNFRQDYPDCKLFKLEQNYRSTRNIIAAANSLIKKNQGQITKEVWSDNERGEKVALLRNRTDTDEGFAVASMIQDTAFRDHVKYNEFAILYRTNAQSRIFEESLRKLNIPYVVYGSLSFYQRREIKDLLAYFRLVVNPYDEEALARIINYPARGIGNTTTGRLFGIAAESAARPWDILGRIDAYQNHFNSGTRRKLRDFRGMMDEFIGGAASMQAFDLAFMIAEKTKILEEFRHDKSPENISRYENIQELLNSIREFSDSPAGEATATLSSYLQNVALLTDADADRNGQKERVTVMTIHAAKGLEFRNVFVTGLEEELFPARLSSSTREELEEERRLFYVAITRARKKLTLSFAERRYRWGVPVYSMPSRFLSEIEGEHLEGDEFGDDQLKGNLMEGNRLEGIRTGSNRTGRDFQGGDRPFGKRPGSTGNARPGAGGRSTGPSGSAKKAGAPRNRVYIPENFKKLEGGVTGGSRTGDFDHDDPEKIKAGMEVEHQRFGKGKVVALDGAPDNLKATVVFDGAGRKQLLLRFARLKIL